MKPTRYFPSCWRWSVGRRTSTQRDRSCTGGGWTPTVCWCRPPTPAASSPFIVPPFAKTGGGDVEVRCSDGIGGTAPPGPWSLWNCMIRSDFSFITSNLLGFPQKVLFSLLGDPRACPRPAHCVDPRACSVPTCLHTLPWACTRPELQEGACTIGLPAAQQKSPVLSSQNQKWQPYPSSIWSIPHHRMPVQVSMQAWVAGPCSKTHTQCRLVVEYLSSQSPQIHGKQDSTTTLWRFDAKQSKSCKKPPQNQVLNQTKHWTTRPAHSPQAPGSVGPLLSYPFQSGDQASRQHSPHAASMLAPSIHDNQLHTPRLHKRKAWVHNLRIPKGKNWDTPLFLSQQVGRFECVILAAGGLATGRSS